jgi:hypothetical protein
MNHLSIFKYLSEEGSCYETRTLIKWLNNELNNLDVIRQELLMIVKYLDLKMEDVEHNCQELQPSEMRLMLEKK